MNTKNVMACLALAFSAGYILKDLLPDSGLAIIPQAHAGGVAMWKQSDGNLHHVITTDSGGLQIYLWSVNFQTKVITPVANGDWPEDLANSVKTENANGYE